MYQMDPDHEHQRAAPSIDECHPEGCSLKVEDHLFIWKRVVGTPIWKFVGILTIRRLH